MKTVRFGFLVLMMVFPLFAAAAQDEGAEAETEAENEAEAEAEKKKEEEIRIESLAKEKRDVLMFGIDSEVLEVISTIRTEKDNSFDEDLAELLRVNDNPEINRALFDFFGQTESDAGVEKALGLVRDHLDDYDLSSNLILSAISYLGTVKAAEAGESFYNLLDDSNRSIASAALRGIGKLEDPARAGEILTLIEENEGDSDYEDLIASAILVLGDLVYGESSEIMEDILQDEDAPAVHRQYAAVTIGKLGMDSGFDLLSEMYLSLKDSLLRSYVLKGLSDYDRPEVEEIMITALRDSFWRIRIAAAEGLGERKTEGAVDILQYKVRKDPVRQVRYASMEALGEIGSSDARRFVLEQFGDAKVAFDIRSKALDIMMEHQMDGAVKVLEEVLADKWEKDKDNELGPICKVLSVTEWDRLKPFYEHMLGHKDFIIRIYGIRGIKLNGISSLRSNLEALDTESQPVNVRREIKAALDVL